MTRSATSDHQPTQLYRAFDADDVLLYVGISLNVVTRMKQHLKDSSWFLKLRRLEVELFGSRAEALAAEAVAIRTERPLFNKMLNGDLVSQVIPPSKASAEHWRDYFSWSVRRVAIRHLLTRARVGRGALAGRVFRRELEDLFQVDLAVLRRIPGWPSPERSYANVEAWCPFEVARWLPEREPALLAEFGTGRMPGLGGHIRGQRLSKAPSRGSPAPDLQVNLAKIDIWNERQVRLVKIDEIAAVLGVERQQVKEMTDVGVFPKPIMLTPRLPVYVASELYETCRKLVAQ